MSEEVVSVLRYLITASNFAVVPALVVCLFRWRSLSPAQKWLGGMVILIFLNQMTAFTLRHACEVRNTPLFHVYVLLEGTGLILLFRRRFQLEVRLRGLLLYAAVGYVLTGVANLLLVQSWFEIPALPRVVEAILLTGLALFYFGYVFREKKVKYLARSFWFWLCTGVLLYFTSNMLLFIFTNYVPTTELDLLTGIWSIHAVLNFLLYLAYTIGLLCQDLES